MKKNDSKFQLANKHRDDQNLQMNYIEMLEILYSEELKVSLDLIRFLTYYPLSKTELFNSLETYLISEDKLETAENIKASARWTMSDLYRKNWGKTPYIPETLNEDLKILLFMGATDATMEKHFRIASGLEVPDWIKNVPHEKPITNPPS